MTTIRATGRGEAMSYFRLIEFNQRRWIRHAPAARVEIDADGDWLWMTAEDARANMREFGKHPELERVLEAYKNPRSFQQAEVKS